MDPAKICRLKIDPFIPIRPGIMDLNHGFIMELGGEVFELFSGHIDLLRFVGGAPVRMPLSTPQYIQPRSDTQRMPPQVTA